MSKESDLTFLKEMKDKLQGGIDNKDPVKLDYVYKMISDWIDELEDNQPRK